MIGFREMSRRKMIQAGTAAAILPACAVPLRAAQTRIVHDAAELTEAFASAPDGAQLLLAPGVYEGAKLRNRTFRQGLTVSSADLSDRAVFRRRVVLEQLDGVTFEGIDVRIDAFLPRKSVGGTSLLQVSDCRNMAFRDMAVTGYIPTTEEGRDPNAPNLKRHFPLTGYGRDKGISILRCETLRVEGVRMGDLRTGLSCNGSRQIELLGLEITRAREGINFVNLEGLRIRACHFHGFRPWFSKASPNRDHPDMIQYWAGKQGDGIRDIEIAECLFHQKLDQPWTQTFYGALNNVKGGTSVAEDIRVIGNTVINKQLLGLAVHDATGVLMADNLLLPTSDQPDKPRQVKTPTISLVRSRDVDVRGNTLLPFAGLKRPVRASEEALRDGRVRLANDNQLLSTRPVHPYYWRKLPQDPASPAAAYRAAQGWQTPEP